MRNSKDGPRSALAPPDSGAKRARWRTRGAELHPPHFRPPLEQWRCTRHGMPITLLDVRHWQPERYRGREEVLHVAYHMEHYIRRMSVYRGRRVERCCIIISLDGFKMAMLPHVYECVSVLRKHYPSRLGAALLINTPGYFRPVWALISKVLDEEIISKVHFLPPSVVDTELAIEWCDSQRIAPYADLSVLV